MAEETPSPPPQSVVRVTDALTHVERYLAVQRQYQFAAIVKSAVEYILAMEISQGERATESVTPKEDPAL